MWKHQTFYFRHFGGQYCLIALSSSRVLHGWFIVFRFCGSFESIVCILSDFYWPFMDKVIAKNSTFPESKFCPTFNIIIPTKRVYEAGKRCRKWPWIQLKYLHCIYWSFWSCFFYLIFYYWTNFYGPYNTSFYCGCNFGVLQQKWRFNWRQLLSRTDR